MTGFFHWSMRNAAGLLFAAAILVLLAGLVPALYELGAIMSRKASSFTDTSGGSWATLLPLLLTGIAGAVWPLFGAALLYRIDRRALQDPAAGANND